VCGVGACRLNGCIGLSVWDVGWGGWVLCGADDECVGLVGGWVGVLVGCVGLGVVGLWVEWVGVLGGVEWVGWVYYMGVWVEWVGECVECVCG
jgi:hypothetical protein